MTTPPPVTIPTRDKVREQLGWRLIPTNGGLQPSR